LDGILHSETVPSARGPEASAEIAKMSAPLHGMLVPIVVSIILATYALPFVATWRQIGVSRLPVLFGPDLYSYLNISNLKSIASGVVANPWYGVPVPKAAIAYLRFGTPVGMFGHFAHMVGGSGFALFLWTLVCILVICLVALWLFKKLLPETGSLMLSAALAFLALINLASAVNWIHIRSLHDLDRTYIFLPYMRTFFPQCAVPLLLGYVGLQLEVIRKRTWKPWLLMVVIQFLGVLVFPYATLLMALTTGVLLAFSLISGKLGSLRSYVLPYAFLCGVVDVGYVFVTGPAVAGLHTGPLVTIDLKFLVVALLSKSVLTVLVCTLLVSLVMREEGDSGKWLVSALGLSYVLLASADAFVSPFFQISHHSSYLTDAVLAIELSFLVATAYRGLIPKQRWLPIAMSLILAGFLLAGVMTSYGMYRFFLAVNAANSEGARIVQLLHLGSQDVVIARSKASDDPATWIPLVSDAHVFFCKNSELLLPARDMPMQDYRRAAYLFLAGHDTVWAEQLLAQRPVSQELWLDLTPIQKRPLLTGAQRDRTLNEIREEMVPLLQKLQNGDPSVEGIFQKYQRVLVLDRTDEPTFSRERLLQYLRVKDEQRIGRYDLVWMDPR
jgi:hypothetical protein